MNFTDEQIKGWMSRVRHLCCHWRSHPQFDDIVASAYLGMWRALQHNDGDPDRDHTGLALDGAWNGAHKFLRSPVCVTSKTTCKGNERPEVLSLTDWQTLSGKDGPVSPPVVPDFAPRLIEWIAANEELQKMPARKRRALILGCIYELSRKEIIEETGWKRDVVYKMLNGIDGLPTAYGTYERRPAP